MLVDSHCHLHCLDTSSESIDDIILRAKENTVNDMLCVCIDLDDADAIFKIIDSYANIHGTIGIHPNSDVEKINAFKDIEDYLLHEKIIAIGETGLDYYRTTENLKNQQSLFASHIEVAKKTNKPLIVHSRNAKQDTINFLREGNAEAVGGIMHCFVEDIEMAKQAIDLNFYISFSGIITFKNAKELQEVVKYVPLDCMLIETDCPYLAPTPFRGKPNEPAYVKYVAEKIAELKKEPYEKVAESTTNNYFDLFNLGRV